MKAWHEQDEFWTKWAPYLFPEGRWEHTDNEVTSLVSLLGIAPGDSVLDLCCGPGRHSLELARRGFSVTGVDRTESYLEQARGRAAAEGLAVELSALLRGCGFDDTEVHGDLTGAPYDHRAWRLVVVGRKGGKKG